MFLNIKMANVIISSDTLKFDNSGVNYGSFTGGATNGLITLSSNAGNVRIAGVLDPINLQDAATKNYADSLVVNPQALTRTNDTNVTLTLGGSPSTSLFNATSLTLGWTGTLSGTRGGTGVNNGSNTITLGGSLTTSGAFNTTLTMTGATSVTLPTSGTLLNNSLTSGNVYVGNGSGVATGVALSGDATLSNTGALTLVNTGVSANSYGSSTQVGTFTVDSKGRLTNSSNVTITSPASTVTDDTTTNATMYPTWVTGTSGNLPIKVSSTKLGFNPSTSTLTLGIENTTSTIRTPSAVTGNNTGGALNLTSGNGGAAAAGGSMALTTGNGGSTSGTSGAMTLSTGTTTDGNTGSVIIRTSNATGTNRDAGNISITGGNGSGTGGGGIVTLTSGKESNLNLNSGPGVNTSAGYVYITAGSVASGNGFGGVVQLTGGNGSASGTGIGGAVNISGGSSNSNTGGNIILTTGASTSGASGTMSLSTANTTAFSGDINLRTGTSTTESIGNVNIIMSSASALNKSGGSLNATCGNSGGGSGAGGSVAITSGRGASFSGTGAGGSISITSGSGGQVLGTTAGGNISITTGAGGSISGNSGNLTLTTGNVSSGVVGLIVLQTANTTRSTISSTTITNTIPILGPNGSATTPAYGFTAAAAGTGMFYENTNILNFTSAGVNRLRIGGSGVLSVFNTTASTSDATGAISLLGGIGISNTTEATSSTNGGTITTAGGVGIAKKLFVGGNVTLEGTSNTLNMNSATSNTILFGTAGAAAPTFTTRSTGTKIVLHPIVSGTTADYAIGIDGGTLWNSIPDAGSSFKWYGGTTSVASLSGIGKLILSNTITTDNPSVYVLGTTNQALSGPAVNLLSSYWGAATSSGSSPPTYSGGLFTIVETGIYAFGFSVMLQTSTTINRNCFMQINGTGTAWANSAGFLQSDKACNTGSVVLKLNASDTVRVSVYSSSASSTDAAVQGSFWITRVA